jgi:hypothetical protein
MNKNYTSGTISVDAGTKILEFLDEGDLFESSHRNTFLKQLFETESDTEILSDENLEEFSNELSASKHKQPILGVDRIVLSGWKNIENIPSRLLENHEKSVILECLIDRENRTYEEREFKKSLFEGYDLQIGNLFYLRVFERPNELKIEVHDSPGLTSSDDFPKLDFESLIRSSRLFK